MFGALLDALGPHPPLLDRVEADIEAAELHQRCAPSSPVPNSDAEPLETRF